jgi:hypothetical protein
LNQRRQNEGDLNAAIEHYRQCLIDPNSPGMHELEKQF